MSFASPMWLWILAPWAALALWMLIGRRPSAAVPFVQLWQSVPGAPRTRRAVTPPPLSTLLLLCAALLGIVAAAGPLLHIGAFEMPVVAIVDHGITMATPKRIAWADGTLRSLSPAEVVHVPGPAPTPLDTTRALQDAIQDALLRPDVRVLVLTDRRIDMSDPRLMRIAPDSLPQNVSIVQIEARDGKHPQVMVRLRNQAQLRDATLTVRSGEAGLTRHVELPAPDQTRDYFVDLPALDRTIAVTIQLEDELQWDNRAWLARDRTWARIEPAPDLPAAVKRVIDVYHNARPPQSGSLRLDIVTTAAKDAATPIVVVAEPRSSASGEIRVIDHPITTSIDWRAALSGPATVADFDLGPVWSPLVKVGDSTLVAARESPARQVWIGFDAPNWSSSVDFVIFWTNVLDWAGQGGEEFVGVPLREAGSQWSRVEPPLAGSEPATAVPGLYADGDGNVRAMNAIDVRFATATDKADPTPGMAASVPARRVAAQVALAAGVLGSLGVLLSARPGPGRGFGKRTQTET